MGSFSRAWRAPKAARPAGASRTCAAASIFCANRIFYSTTGSIKIALAEAEGRAGDVDRALAVLDEALATSERIGHRAFEAELHRVRGEMLLKREPADTVAAEEALQTAIAVARQQGTRSFELRAALALAKLYQSIGRPADAHAVLAPALEGFAPTPGNARDRRGADTVGGYQGRRVRHE